MATRRERGTGTISATPDGRWKARLRYSPPNGGPERNRTKICATYADANRTIKQWQKEILQENFVDVKKDSVSKFMTNWLETYKKPELKPTSYDRLELTIRHHIIPMIGKHQMGSLDADIIQRLISQQLADGKSYSTVKKIYDALNACFKWGVAAKKLSYNPMDAVIIPGQRTKKNKQKKNPKIKFYTEEQQDALIAAATATYPTGTPIYRFGYAVPLLLNTGMRLGEMLALQWKRDVDMEARTIRIENSLVLVQDRSNNDKKTTLLEQDSVKSEAGERVLYLNDEALDAMQHLYQLTGSQTYVFSTKHNRPVQPSNIERMIRCARERANIPDNGNAHALRHSFASNLFRNHVDVKTVSTLLGHADVSITMNTYIHLIDEQKQDALVKISARKA